MSPTGQGLYLRRQPVALFRDWPHRHNHGWNQDRPLKAGLTPDSTLAAYHPQAHRKKTSSIKTQAGSSCLLPLLAASLLLSDKVTKANTALAIRASTPPSPRRQG